MRNLFCVLLIGCGVSPEDAVDFEDPAEAVQDLSVRSPASKVVIWQQNIEAMKAAKAGPWRLTNAMLTHKYKPDIIVLAEAWQKVLCGDYANPDAKGDRDLSNWLGSRQDARGLAYTCREGKEPLPGSVLQRLGSALWGGVAHVGHRRPFDDAAGSTGRTGTSVVWDKSRFRFEDDFVYDDADVPGCANTLAEYKRTVVLLRDTRRTSATGDDRLIAVAAVHYGTACRTAANRWVAEQMVRRWGESGLDLRVIGGDFNAEVDTTSNSYSERRREADENEWYRDFTRNNTWRGGRFVDSARTAAGDICSQWTYPNVSHCAGFTACGAQCPGFGIGGRLERIDYTFVSNAAGTLDPDRVASSKTDDKSAGYSDHKATVTVVGW